MNEQLDPIDELYTNPAPLVDFIKLQIGFWEKIVVLDSAILGLSFTAVAFLRVHTAGDGGVGYLIAAWKLLFWAIGLSLVAQWIAIPGAIGIFGYVSGMRVLSLLQARSPLKDVDLALTSEVLRQVPNFKARASLSRVAGSLGSVGVLTTIAAFYWLFRFAQANVSTPRH